MFYAAKALMKMQALYGVIPNIYGKGHCAKVSKNKWMNYWVSQNIIMYLCDLPIPYSLGICPWEVRLDTALEIPCNANSPCTELF